MRKEKPNRIYIFVSRTLETSRGTVKMPNGRAAAQCAHVAAHMVEMGYGNISDMTTIVLAASSSKHLFQIVEGLRFFKISYVPQVDTFEDGKEAILQAVATLPITEKQALIFKFFELW